MATTISATEFARRLSDTLNRARYRGEHFVIERNGEPIALLTPVGARPGATWREIMAMGDLRPPGDGFADDLEAIQANQPLAEFPEWPSS